MNASGFAGGGGPSASSREESADSSLSFSAPSLLSTGARMEEETFPCIFDRPYMLGLGSVAPSSVTGAGVFGGPLGLGGMTAELFI